MERRLKERLIGAAVLVMLAVIFIPMILDDSVDPDTKITESNIPERPEDNFSSRIVPLKESDMMTIEPAPEIDIEEEQLVESVEEITVQDTVTKDAAAELSEAEPPIAEKPLKSPSTNNQVGATAWVVQLGSFSSEENARKLNQKLREAEYPAFVEPLKRKSGMAYRVRVGPELLRSDAQALQDKLRKEMKIEGIVIRYP